KPRRGCRWDRCRPASAGSSSRIRSNQPEAGRIDRIWVVVPGSIDLTRLRLVRPTADSGRTAALRGITVVNVTENRFVVANGRRYRGRITVSAGRGGLTVVNRVGVESYIAGVVGPEIGARRPDETDAVLAQAVVSRSFAIKNRGRWD